MKRFILFVAAVALSLTTAMAQSDNIAVATKEQMTQNEATAKPKRDKSQRFLPTSRRIDRNIDRNKFLYRGEVMLGLTASYGTMNAADADLLMVLDDINFGLNRLTVRPFVAYAYRDNRAVGLRFGYEMMRGELGNIALDLGSIADIGFSLSGLGIDNESYSWALFHRNYMGLDRRGIVGVIFESELLVRTGTSSISMTNGEDISVSKSRNLAARLNFNPGLAVYVFPEVCVTVTVGIGGLYYTTVRQEDINNLELGRRDRSGLKFKFNIADIQIGIVAHLWNKKKK
ncbi:MAG: hypothetical protein IKC57_04200 [Alistipes sp.]|nr:hypothetical protein [Alistipes sp.]